MLKIPEVSSKKWDLKLSRTESLLIAIIGDVIRTLHWDKMVGRIFCQSNVSISFCRLLQDIYLSFRFPDCLGTNGIIFFQMKKDGCVPVNPTGQKPFAPI